MLTAKQHQLLTFIQSRLEEGGVSPSFEEMKDALDLRSKSGVHRLISALEERGFIRRLPNRARALEVVRQIDRSSPTVRPARRELVAAANDVVELPLHGRIAAGQPVEALEDQAILPVPAALLGPGDHYALEISGDSMVEAGILDGDYALVKTADEAREGQIVVALIDDHEATLKYYRREGSMVRLDPANRDYSPQRYRPGQVRVQGTLSGLLRRY